MNGKAIFAGVTTFAEEGTPVLERRVDGSLRPLGDFAAVGEAESLDPLLTTSAEELPRKIAEKLNWFQASGIRQLQRLDIGAGFRALRRLMDEWIDSGKADECEMPLSRKVVSGSPLHQSLAALSGEYRVRLEVAEDGSSRWTLIPPLYKRAFREKYYENQAALVFLEFLKSPSRALISRCDGCRLLLVRQRWPRAVIRHGSFCEGCKSVGGARREGATNDDRHRELLRLAARYWQKWPASKSTPRTQSAWIAKEMKLCLPRWKDSISGNWVTRHRDEIELTAEGGEHATR